MIIDDSLFEYLEKEWYYNNHKKYHKYFIPWISNLTDNQVYYYYTLWMKVEI